MITQQFAAVIARKRYAIEPQEAYSETLNHTDQSGYANTNVRVVIPASRLSGAGSMIRVTLQAAASEALEVYQLFIGESAVTPDPADFDGNQQQMYFSSGESTTVSNGSTKATDWLAFPYDNSKDLIVSVGTQLIGVGTSGYKSSNSATDVDTYIGVNSGDKAGDRYVSYSLQSGWNLGVPLIEVK